MPDSPPVHPSRRDAVPGEDKAKSSRARSRSPPRGPRNPDGDRDHNARDRRRHDDRSDGRDRGRDRPRKGGFKYKEKRRDEDNDGGGARGGGLERGYRNRSPRRERRDRGDEARNKTAAAAAPAPAPAPAPAQHEEEMIVVHVNDRLGTKAAIPCLASDTIKGFKMMVAARIGREPHEIMLKRQGERPFKDHLTLDDYGVSNGVQLDLEMDAGD